MKTSDRIALVYAGGTIGMQIKNGELAPPRNEQDFEKACKIVTDEFSDRYDVGVDFKYFDKKDSTERTPKDWVNLYEILKNLQESYSSIVVAHGTDTLANTSSAISYAFSHPSNPQESSQSSSIIFTASQQPIYTSSGDGKFNLYHSLEVSLQMQAHKLNRVVISLWDKVHLATRAVKNHDTRYDAFESPASQPIGRITASGVSISHFLQSIKLNPEISSPNFSEGVATLELSPSTPSGIIQLLSRTERTKVLILKTLGAGNVPSRLIPEIKSLSEAGGIVVITSPFAGGSVGSSVYELGAEAVRAGAIPAGDMVPPAVDAKCAWFIANGINDRKQFSEKLQTDYVGEISEESLKQIPDPHA